MGPLDFILGTKNTKGQVEFSLDRPHELDRNHVKGGRSFYFFDFDDNVMYLPTPLYIFDKASGKETVVSTHEFAVVAPLLGKSGLWENHEVRICPETGSFRRFRNRNLSILEKIKGAKQPLLEDILKVLNENTIEEWQGPSWKFFWHAVHNQRPMSIITARGHSSKTIKDGITLLARKGHLTRTPNYLSVYPVSNLDIRAQLGDVNHKWTTAKLKQEAIISSVELALKTYGYNENHRFGMSDDDPKNLELIVEAMHLLKSRFPTNSFFVIDTHGGRLVKQEILVKGEESSELSKAEQLSFF